MIDSWVYFKISSLIFLIFKGGANEHSKKGIVGTTKDGDFYAYHLVKFAKVSYSFLEIGYL